MFPPAGNSITMIYTQAMFSILWKCFFLIIILQNYLRNRFLGIKLLILVCKFKLNKIFFIKLQQSILLIAIFLLSVSFRKNSSLVKKFSSRFFYSRTLDFTLTYLNGPYSTHIRTYTRRKVGPQFDAKQKNLQVTLVDET